MIETTTKRRRTTFASSAIPSLRLVREGGAPTVTYIRGPRDAERLLLPFFAPEPAEVFVVLMLDAQHKVIGGAPVVITRGTLNSSLVHPREVFRPAIAAGAAAIILAHNHPSGDARPSAEDRQVTAGMVAAGRLLDIPVHDHVIIGANGNGATTFHSFAEAGEI